MLNKNAAMHTKLSVNTSSRKFQSFTVFYHMYYGLQNAVSYYLYYLQQYMYYFLVGSIFS